MDHKSLKNQNQWL